MSATIDTWTGRLGLAAGVCAVAAWLLIAGRPPAAPEPSASVRLGTLSSGELEVSPTAKAVLASSDLAPGRAAARGAVGIRNQTPVPVDVSFRTTSVQKDLDEAARVELAHGERTLRRATLAASRGWSRETIRLKPDERRRLDVRVWIPRGAPDGWQAAHTDLTLQLRAAVVKRR